MNSAQSSLNFIDKFSCSVDKSNISLFSAFVNPPSSSECAEGEPAHARYKGQTNPGTKSHAGWDKYHQKTWVWEKGKNALWCGVTMLMIGEREWCRMVLVICLFIYAFNYLKMSAVLDPYLVLI